MLIFTFFTFKTDSNSKMFANDVNFYSFLHIFFTRKNVFQRHCEFIMNALTGWSEISSHWEFRHRDFENVNWRESETMFATKLLLLRYTSIIWPNFPNFDLRLTNFTLVNYLIFVWYRCEFQVQAIYLHEMHDPMIVRTQDCYGCILLFCAQYILYLSSRYFEIISNEMAPLSSVFL